MLKGSTARFLLLALLAAAPLVALPSMALAASGKNGDAEDAAAAKKKRLAEAYEEMVKDSKHHEGFFDLRTKEGSLYLDLGSDDLGKQFLLVGQIAEGASRGFALGGMMLSMGNEWVLEFRKQDERILLVRKNIRFKADKNSPMEEAVDISFSDSIVAAFDPVGVKGRTLISLDGYLLSDLFEIGPGFGGGGVLTNLSSWSSIKSFPRNSELEATLTYAGNGSDAGGTVPDPSKITLTMHYSLVAMPESGYKPRKADDRVGHFLTALKDFSRPAREGPFVRYVNRWRLEKADPKAPRSTVKQPIVFYLEKTIPYEYRPYIRAGVLEWNKAFAKAGLIDAIEVRLQSPDADWDPEDVRYNTIRWITSPHTFAIGPSHSNPLTGEILDADILIDNSWIAAWQREAELFALEAPEAGRGSWASRWIRARPGAPRGASHEGPLETLPPPSLRLADLRDHQAFTRGFARQFALGGMQVLAEVETTKEEGDEEKDEDDEENGKKKKEDDAPELPLWYVGSALKDLVMHEVGHTLGLRHNFRASSIRSREELHDRDLTEEKGLVGSVMDYVPVNLAPEGVEQGEYHPSTLGPYDYWAIEYAYASVNGKKLDEIAARCATPELTFASDEDRMFGLDPLVHAWDLGGDPLQFAKDRQALVRDLWKVVLDRVVREGEGYQRARSAVVGLLTEVFVNAKLAASYVGGQYHYRDHKGDPDARPTFVLVEPETQRQALAFLGEGVFSDSSYQLPPELLNHLAPNHWWHWGESPQFPLDFPLHEWVQLIQEIVFFFVLDPGTLQRLVDMERKSEPDADVFTAPELTSTLTSMIFRELDQDPAKKEWSARDPYVSSLRRNLQRTYVSVLSRLLAYVPPGYYADTPVVARAALAGIGERLGGVLDAHAAKLDPYSRAHLVDLRKRVEQLLDAEVVTQTF